MMRRFVPVLALTCSMLVLSPPATAAAQQTDFQAWSLLTANVSLSDDKSWLLYLEAQARLGDDASRMERLLLRPAVGRQLTRSVTAFLGYAWTPTFMNTSYESDFRSEHRIWQQLVVRHGGGRLAWQHRIRQEQRMIAETSGMSHRTRYLVRGSSTDYGSSMHAGSEFHYDKGGALYAEGQATSWGKESADRMPLRTLRFFIPMIRIEMALRSAISRFR